MFSTTLTSRNGTQLSMSCAWRALGNVLNHHQRATVSPSCELLLRKPWLNKFAMRHEAHQPLVNIEFFCCTDLHLPLDVVTQTIASWIVIDHGRVKRALKRQSRQPNTVRARCLFGWRCLKVGGGGKYCEEIGGRENTRIIPKESLGWGSKLHSSMLPFGFDHEAAYSNS